MWHCLTGPLKTYTTPKHHYYTSVVVVSIVIVCKDAPHPVVFPQQLVARLCRSSAWIWRTWESMWAGCTISTCSSQASMCWSRGNSPSSTHSSLLWWPWSFTPPMCLCLFTCGWRWSSSLSWSEGNPRAQWPSWTHDELLICCVIIGLKTLVYFSTQEQTSLMKWGVVKAMFKPFKSSTFTWIPAPSWDLYAKIWMHSCVIASTKVLHDITHHIRTLLGD